MNTIQSHLAAAAILTALTAATPASAAPATADPATGISVMERFRTYTGVRTPSALSALFTVPANPAATQVPDPAFSDGTSTVTVTVKNAPSAATAPNFAVNGGRLVSHQRLATGELRVELLPDAETLNCTLVMVSGAAATDIPLTVVPPLSAAFDLTGAGFSALLGSQDAGSKPIRDVNGDNRLDYLDDYVLTANFLARKKADPHDPATRNQRAREMTPQRLLKPPAAAGK